MTFRNKKAFTLIELLVVIAIIGVISSIVLVNLKGSQEKARLAKSLQFSQSVRHALGAYAVGVWSFDDSIADASTTDISGYDNYGIVVAAVPATGIIGSALYFDEGSSDYVEVANSGSLNITDEITIEMWIKMNYVNNTGNWAVRKIDQYTMFVYSAPTFNVSLRDAYQFGVVSGGSPYYSGTYSCNKYGTWHHVVGTAKVGEKVKLYVDGELRKESVADLPGSIDTTVNVLRIGRTAMPTIIDEVRIYNEALTIGQIQKHYAEELERHGDLVLGE